MHRLRNVHEDRLPVVEHEGYKSGNRPDAVRRMRRMRATVQVRRIDVGADSAKLHQPLKRLISARFVAPPLRRKPAALGFASSMDGELAERKMVGRI